MPWPTARWQQRWLVCPTAAAHRSKTDSLSISYIWNLTRKTYTRKPVRHACRHGTRDARASACVRTLPMWKLDSRDYPKCAPLARLTTNLLVKIIPRLRPFPTAILWKGVAGYHYSAPWDHKYNFGLYTHTHHDTATTTDERAGGRRIAAVITANLKDTTAWRFSRNIKRVRFAIGLTLRMRK